MAKQNKNSKESTLYYFYSVGCGFCKKADPIVDELIAEGHDILKLDMAEPDNQGLSNELKQTYNAQCGTPWFIDAETGNQVCGFRDKETLTKWVNGEEVPAPPRPKGPPPKIPFHDAPKKEVTTWKKDYEKWCEENSHLPNLQKADDILSRPRPKSDPPRPPAPNSTPEQFDDWAKIWDEWAEENKHLPNLQSADQIIARMQSQQNQMNAPPAPHAAPSIDPKEVNDLREKVKSMDSKLTSLMNHLGVKHS